MNTSPDHLRHAAQSIVDDYETEVSAARAKRDARLRTLKEAAEATQTELAQASGYTRETMRRILRPTARDRVNELRRKQRARGAGQ